MSEWTTIKVASLLSSDRGISVGVMYPGKHSEEGVPLIRAGDIKQGVIDPFVSFRIGHEVHEEYKRTALVGGEVLITLVGNPGVAAIVPTDMAGWNAARAVAVVRLAEPTDAHFFKMALGAPSVQHTIASVCNTTVQATLNLKEIKELELPWPDRATREEIAAVLGALDDKIELNRKTAATLEAMARALYRSWFVDFDPVHAKAEGRAPGHMPPETAALFPARFGPDGLPEGWEAGTLGDLINFNPREKISKGSDAPYLDMKALPTSGMTADPAYQRAFTSGTKFRVGDTLLARITPCLENGKTAMVDDLLGSEVGWGSTEFIVMRGKPGVPSSLPYCVARDPSFREEAIATMTGSSGRQRADAVRISQVDCAVPPMPVLSAFAEATDPMVRRIHALGKENQTLATLRDTLLPRLMSGDLRVGAAREQVEDVA